MLRFWLLAAPLFLVGCPSTPPADLAAASKANKERRMLKAEAQLAKPPVPRTYTIQGNQIQVVELPVADTSGFVDQQRCFIYRDAEFKTSSISCESRPEVVIKDSN